MPPAFSSKSAARPRASPRWLRCSSADELSVSPARLDLVRSTVRRLWADDACTVARQALSTGSAEAALDLAGTLLLEAADEVDQAGHGLGGVVA